MNPGSGGPQGLVPRPPLALASPGPSSRAQRRPQPPGGVAPRSQLGRPGCSCLLPACSGPAQSPAFPGEEQTGVRAGPGHSAPQCPLKPRPPGASSLEALKGLVSLARQGAAPVGPCSPGRPSRWVSGTRSHLATQRPGLPRWLPGSSARPDHLGSWCVPRAPPVSSCLGFWEKRLPETEPAGMQWALCPPCLPVLSQGPPASQPRGDSCSS